MTGRFSRIDHRALGLISAITDTPDAQIAAQALRTYHAAAGRQLLAAGLLARAGDDAVSTSMVDHDDEPVPLTRSPDDGSYGYFSPNAGWVKVGPEQTAIYRLDMPALLPRLSALSAASCSRCLLDRDCRHLRRAFLPRRFSVFGGPIGSPVKLNPPKRQPTHFLRTFPEQLSIPL